MKRIVFALVLLVLFNGGLATRNTAGVQSPEPVRWHFTTVPVDEHTVRIVFTANLNEGWHIYSQHLEEGGPLPTTFRFAPSDTYSLKGKVREESKPYTKYDETFMMDIAWYKNTAIFSQEVKLKEPATVVRGKIEFMVCTEELCLPPEEISFRIEVKASPPQRVNKGK